MGYDEDWDEDLDEAYEADGDEDPGALRCPDCGADVYADADACPECGYWITDADRSAAWRAGSASGAVRTIGLWMIGVAAAGTLLMWLLR